MMPERPPRILFYAVNGLGLGHVMRLLAIARKARQEEPEAEVLFLTSSEADRVIYREGFAAVKVPSKTLREEAGVRKKTYLKLVQNLVWTTVSSFDPDVLVVDTFPLGNLNELAPVLSWGLRKIFVFREQKAQMAQHALVQNALKLYDLVIVPHDELANVPVPAEVPQLRVGPILIRDRTEVPSRTEARARLGLPADDPVLYVTFGGGGEPEIHRLVRLVGEVLADLPDLKVVLGSGPLYRERRNGRGNGTGTPYGRWKPNREEAGMPNVACSLAQALGPRAITLPDDLFAVEALPAFDLAVASAGYNTAHELLHLGVPAVYIPLLRVMDDQILRARWIDQNGAGISVGAPDAPSLSDAIRRLLDERQRQAVSRHARRLVPENGALRAAREVVRLARAAVAS